MIPDPERAMLLQEVAALRASVVELARPASDGDVPLLLEDRFGRHAINPDKLGEQWFILPLDDQPLAVPANGRVSSGWSIPEDAGHAGDFEVAGLVGRGTTPFLLRMSAVGIEANAFSQNPVHHALCLGQGALPFTLAETAFFPAGSFVSVEVTNLSTTLAGSVELALVGRKLTNEMPEGARRDLADFLRSRPSRPYWAVLDRSPVSLTAGQKDVERYITMPSGSHLTAEMVLAESSGPFDVKIYDGQSGRQLTYGAIDSRLITGHGGLPARTLGAPIIQPRRSLRVLFSDRSGEANTIYFALHGRRLQLPVARSAG